MGTTTDNVEKRLNLIENKEHDLLAFKFLFKSLGFIFEKNIIKFPSDKLKKKLELLYNCLSVFSK